MTSDQLLYLIIGITIFDFLFGLILDFLNNRKIETTLPKEMEGYYDEDTYRKSMEYKKINDKFGLLTGSISFVVTVLFLWFGGFGYLNSLISPAFESPIMVGLVYFGLLFIASDILTLPFQIYRTFVIEARFDFNTTTPKTFIADKLKGYLLGIILGGTLLSVLLWLILVLEGDFWVYFWGIATLFVLFIQLFYSSIILPLFNKLTPLEDGELKDAIFDYCRKVKFPLTHVFVIDGSKRSKKSNAFFMGLGKRKKIVLYDTLIENHSVDELVSVMAHEVGHYKKKHIITGMVISILQMGFTLFILSLVVLNENISMALGAEGLAIHINLIAFGILFSPISTVTGILMNIFSRKNEFEADRYARETFQGGSLISALKKLSADNLSFLFPHPAYVFVNYSHPPLLERIKAIKEG